MMVTRRTTMTVKRLLALTLAAVLLAGCLTGTVFAEGKELTILFTHDIHDYLYPTATVEDGETVEHGGGARLASVVKQYDGPDTIYIDGGDFSMGTLYQAAYATDAYELRNLGLTGCAVTTFGNHEFDYGADAVAEMLRVAMKSGDPLPLIVQSNIDFSGELTESQKNLAAAFGEYGVKDYAVVERAGYRIGFFGLEGLDSIECIQTDLNYVNYIEAAKRVVTELEKDGCDIIIALSHSGIAADRVSGEDVELAKAVSGIDVILSAHTHSTLQEPLMVGETAIICCGEYLKNVGRLTLSVAGNKVKIGEYELIPLDSSVIDNEETLERLAEYKENINENYLADEGVAFDDVICHSTFDMISLNEMYGTHQEYTTGNLIADSYMYEAERCGITDIDVALVGLGTIRSSIREGNITVADAFEICSLGVGGDGSAGHPLATAYITGKELKLLTELDASLGTLVSSIKMSYSGLEYTFNPNRVILDRVTDVHLLRKDGTIEEIEDDGLYKVCANMYAINMLGMLNGLTKGILSITPKYADGTPIEDFYDVTLKNEKGGEIKEWVAFKNYLSSFEPNEEGVPELPSYYAMYSGRKNIADEDGIAAMVAPGKGTDIFSIVNMVIALIAVVVVITAEVAKSAKRRKRGKFSTKNGE